MDSPQHPEDKGAISPSESAKKNAVSANKVKETVFSDRFKNDQNM